MYSYRDSEARQGSLPRRLGTPPDHFGPVRPYWGAQAPLGRLIGNNGYIR